MKNEKQKLSVDCIYARVRQVKKIIVQGNVIVAVFNGRDISLASACLVSGIKYLIAPCSPAIRLRGVRDLRCAATCPLLFLIWHLK